MSYDEKEPQKGGAGESQNMEDVQDGCIVGPAGFDPAVNGFHHALQNVFIPSRVSKPVLLLEPLTRLILVVLTCLAATSSGRG